MVTHASDQCRRPAGTGSGFECVSDMCQIAPLGAEYQYAILRLLMRQVSSVELERVVIASVSAVTEAAAVGVTPPGGGPDQLVMFLVLHQTHNQSAATAQAPRKVQDDGASTSQPSYSKQPHPGPTGMQASGNDQPQVKGGDQMKAMAVSSQAYDRRQDEKATDVGIGPTLDGLWDAVARAKSAAASAASRVTDLAATAVQKASIHSGEQQVAGAEAGSSDRDLHQLKLQCQQAIRASLNPLFKLERVLLRESLPRTASNKVMRRVLRDELRITSPKL